GHVGELPAEGLRPRPRLRDTWRLRTPPERSAEPRARGVRIGTWRSWTRLWGSESTAEDPEHFHLWDTWRTGSVPTWWSRSEAIGPVRRSRTAGVRLLRPSGRS